MHLPRCLPVLGACLDLQPLLLLQLLLEALLSDHEGFVQQGKGRRWLLQENRRELDMLRGKLNHADTDAEVPVQILIPENGGQILKSWPGADTWVASRSWIGSPCGPVLVCNRTHLANLLAQPEAHVLSGKLHSTIRAYCF
jgi:hypothetical protein